MTDDVRESLVRELAFALHRATGGAERSECKTCRERVEAMMPVFVAGVYYWLAVQGDDRSAIELAEMFVARFKGE